MFCQIFWVVFGAFYLASQSNIKEVLVSLIQQTQFPCEIDKTPVYMWEIKIKNSTLKPICINNFRYWWKRGSCVLLFFIKGSPGETCLNSAFWRSVSSEPRFSFLLGSVWACWFCRGSDVCSRTRLGRRQLDREASPRVFITDCCCQQHQAQRVEMMISTVIGGDSLIALLEK